MKESTNHYLALENELVSVKYEQSDVLKSLKGDCKHDPEKVPCHSFMATAAVNELSQVVNGQYEDDWRFAPRRKNI